ncbi:hypothetical protein JCM5350_002759 [Sporobolomyces pararoseus]
MSTELVRPTKIDRLSSLPPELLDDIFEYAYDADKPVKRPLSKRLLHYFYLGLYREPIFGRFSRRLSNLLKFMRTVEARPALGAYVRILDIRGTDGVDAQETFFSILKLFPSLTSLTADYLPVVSVLSRYDPEYYTLDISPIEYLSFRSNDFDIDLVGSLTHFAFLSRLHLSLDYDTRPWYGDSLQTLPQLKELVVEGGLIWENGKPAWGRILPHFISRCPNLTSVKFVTSDLRASFSHVFSQLDLVEKSLRQLTSLTLYMPERSRLSPSRACDHFLPHFPHLFHLGLGDGAITPSAPSYLRQLPFLTSLYLGPGTHKALPTHEILSLLQGPYRITSLKLLKLNCVKGVCGKFVHLGYRGKLENINWGFHGWKKPNFTETFDSDHLKMIRTVGKENQTEVVGSSFEAGEVVKLGELDLANRAILYAHHSKDLQVLRSPVRDRFKSLPDLDPETLDPERLRIVEITKQGEILSQFTLRQTRRRGSQDSIGEGLVE